MGVRAVNSIWTLRYIENMLTVLLSIIFWMIINFIFIVWIFADIFFETVFFKLTHFWEILYLLRVSSSISNRVIVWTLLHIETVVVFALFCFIEVQIQMIINFILSWYLKRNFRQIRFFFRIIVTDLAHFAFSRNHLGITLHIIKIKFLKLVTHKSSVIAVCYTYALWFRTSSLTILANTTVVSSFFPPLKGILFSIAPLAKGDK